MPKNIYNVFKYIDTNKSLKYTEFAKKIIGINKWSDVIPDLSCRNNSKNKAGILIRQDTFGYVFCRIFFAYKYQFYPGFIDKILTRAYNAL